MTPAGIRERLQRAPAVAVDAGLAAVVAAAIAITISASEEAGAQEPDALAYLLAVGIAALLLVRRRWPLAVFLFSVAMLVAYHALDYPAIGLAVPLAPAMYSAAQAGHLRAIVVVFAGLELWAIGWRVLEEDESLVSAIGTQTLFEASLVAAVLLLAEALRSRRAWMAEVRERARRTELERERDAERRLEQERLRIAREMHDVLAHTIAVIGVQADVAAEALADRPEQAEAALRTIREKSREAMAEVRATVDVLRARREGAPRSPAPGLERLEELVRVAEDAGVSTEVSVTGAARSLPAAVDLTAYRIVQESLTNVLRHAGATRAHVAIGYEPEAVVVEVEDDGEGVRNGVTPTSDGHGLAGMRERAASLGGRLDAGPASGPSRGFRVRAWLPTGSAQS